MVASPLELSVILPAYNEEGAIARVVGALRQGLSRRGALGRGLLAWPRSEPTVC